jgi:hypothetical protein
MRWMDSVQHLLNGLVLQVPALAQGCDDDRAANEGGGRGTGAAPHHVRQPHPGGGRGDLQRVRQHRRGRGREVQIDPGLITLALSAHLVH